MRFIYTLFVRFYTLAIRLAAPFNTKAAQWVKGRKHLLNDYQNAFSDNKSPVVWFHASSLGEFEQGRPVIEAIKQTQPHVKILLTFFSPSGYTIRKNYSGADYIFYLPPDTPTNARLLLDTVKPVYAVFIKYEFWFNYLNRLNKENIPVYFISAIFRKEHWFFKWYGVWALKQLKKINLFFVQNDTSKSLLEQNGISSVVQSGDTRFDRVRDIAAQPAHLPLINAFAQNNKLVVAGSTWPQDDELLVNYIQKKQAGVKFIIVPHDIHPSYISQLLSRFGCPAIRYSEISEAHAPLAEVIVVDSIGLLSSLYAYAHIAYIGGGFGKGIHNILEAACHGVPVIFGPNYHKFAEAHSLLKAGGAFTITNAVELEETLNGLLNDENIRTRISEICRFFVIDNSGATQIIMNTLAPLTERLK